MKRISAILSGLLLLACISYTAAAEIPEEEQDYFYNQMDALVYTIGNRNMMVDGQEKAVEYLTQEYQTLGCSFEDGTLQLGAVNGINYLDYTFHSYNVIGIRKASASDPNIIILCAHFDSNGPGARDNASGVAGVLTFLRRFYQAELYENAELRFIAFTAEETGHQGSAAYVQSLPQEERDRIIAVFNMDIIVVDDWDTDASLSCDTLGGRTADGYIDGQVGVPVNNRVSRAFMQAIADLQSFDPAENGEAYAVPRHKGSSDHDAFHLAGIDSANISFRGNTHTDGSWSGLIHTESDLIDAFDWDRTWQALDIIYTAVDGLARDPAYGQGMD